MLLRSIRRGSRSRDQVLTILQSLPSRCSLYVRSDLLVEIIEEVRAMGST